MKGLLLIFIVCLSRGVFSQEIDTIQSRWIEISLDSINEDLFTIVDDLPILKKYLSNSDTLLFYEERNVSEQAFKMYLTFYSFEYADSVYSKHHFITSKNYIPFLPSIISVYMDSEGIAIFIDCSEIPDGSMCSISPSSDEYEIDIIQFNRISKIRIREDFIYLNERWQYVASGISFIKRGNYEQKYYSNQGVFDVQTEYWIDLRKFIQIVNKIDAPWIKAILTRSYSGFQYMQMK